jgi:uncharacterized protein
MKDRMLFRTFNQEQERIRNEGTFPQLMAHRLRFELGAFLRWTWYIPGADLMMFVLGLYAVRRGVLREPGRHRAILITVSLLGMVLGQAADHLPAAWVTIPGEALRLQSARMGLTFAVLNPMFQGLAYGAALLLWIAHSREFPRLCRWLTQAGRMSLTNYVVQICTLEILFAGFGVTITRPMGLLFTIAFFAVQVLYGKWWFARYRIGPLEWLWRSLTYGERQRLRVAAPTLSQV